MSTNMTMPSPDAPPTGAIPLIPSQSGSHNAHEVPAKRVFDSLPTPAEDPQWYRTSVFYEVLTHSFFDANDDGTGDFEGLTQKLDYLEWLGIDAIWIPPFYPSPMDDGGYDISNYTDVDPRYGSFESFKTLVSEAHKHRIRVVIDMVMNHTSSAHPWFQASRQDPSGPYKDFYVWRDRPTEYLDARVIFIDTEDSNWSFDEVRGQYYWHRFFSHQPDLNFENPAVREAVKDVIRFWADTGVDGFRLDAIPYLFEEDGTNCENLPRTHDFIAQLRQLIDDEYPGTVLIAEANQPPHEVVAYFGSDARPECHVCFHFPIMPKIFAALREETSRGVREAFAATPPLPKGGQWGTFLRNHDELTLEMVTEEERQAMYGWYAPEPRMRANVGIRRRLMPLLRGSRREVELAHAMLLSFPGSPFLYYGDEIGMGDNIWLKDRDGVRTPMQWDSSAGAGFSKSDPKDFYLPIIDEGAYSPAAVNVAEHRARPTSMLNWLRGMLEVRKRYPVFGIGSLTLLSTSDDAVLAYLRRDERQTVLCVNNLSTTSRSATIALPGMAGWHLYDTASGNRFPDVKDDETIEITLGRHGFYWLDVTFLDDGEEED